MQFSLVVAAVVRYFVLTGSECARANFYETHVSSSVLLFLFFFFLLYSLEQVARIDKLNVGINVNCKNAAAIS